MFVRLGAEWRCSWLMAFLYYLAVTGFPLSKVHAKHDNSIRQARPLLIINEDNSHFFLTRRPEDMTVAGLNAWVDQYVGTAVSHLFLCPNAMRANFRSHTRDAIWDPVEGKKPQNIWPQNAKRLFEKGIDPYKVWISRSRQKGLSPWLSMRMNDVHEANNIHSFMHSTFWRSHPEYWRVPKSTSGPWTDRALDYSRPEVWKYEFAFVRELLERYDPDGLELDWMRFGYHLPPGKERENAHVLTEFVRRVRELTKCKAVERGHPIHLGVRVPTHPDAAAGLGMDAVLWGKEGLVDMIVPSPFWASSDFDIPIELWQKRLGSSARRIQIVPSIEYQSRPWPGAAAVPNDVACVRGFAAAAYYRGAQGIYLFNWMDSQTRPVRASVYSAMLHKGFRPQDLVSAFRRHPVCYRDTVPSGFPNDIQLPVEAYVGKTFRIHIGARPKRGSASVVVGLAGDNPHNPLQLIAFVNGKKIGTQRPFTELFRLGGRPTKGVQFPCRLSVLHDGNNEVTVRQKKAERSGWKIVWVELQINGEN